jgi:hypothetical protein
MPINTAPAHRWSSSAQAGYRVVAVIVVLTLVGPGSEAALLAGVILA